MQDTLLNLIPGACSPEVHLSQYDKGRAIPFKLANGKSAYTVPEGAEIVVMATKPSGLGFVVPVTFEGDTATMTITETMSNEYGRFPAELSITSNGNRIGTANFVMNIERSPHPEGTIDGDVESLLPELTLLVKRIEDSNARIESMTATATTLATGEDATAEYDPVNNQLVLGLPRGEKGEQGEGVASLEPRVSANENAINVLDARMNAFASLPPGSTSGNAELLDIRVGTDGTTYPSAGDSVREQVGNLKNNVKKYSESELLPFTISGWESNGTITNGENASQYNAARTANIAQYNKDVILHCDSGYRFFVVFYNADDSYNRTSQLDSYDVIIPANTKFRLVMRAFPDVGGNGAVFSKHMYIRSESYVNSIKIDFHNRGLQLIPAPFEVGTLLADGEIPDWVTDRYIRSILFEVDHTTVITAETGYKFSVFFYDTDGTTLLYQSNMVSGGSLLVAKGDKIKIIIGTDGNALVITDILDLLKHVYFDNCYLDNLEADFSKQNKALFSRDMRMGLVSNGVINHNLGFVCSKDILHFDRKILIHADEGYSYGLAYYDSNGTYISGEPTSKFDVIVPANTYFRIVIRRVTYEETIKSPLDYMSHVTASYFDIDDKPLHEWWGYHFGIAHGGADGLKPFNTLISFKYAIGTLKQRLMETDLRFTSDNVPVLLHNSSIDATSDGTGEIASMTYEDVLQYDFGSYFDPSYAGTKIGTLEELLKLCRDTEVYLCIDIKTELTDAQLLILKNMVGKYEMGNKVMFASADIVLYKRIWQYFDHPLYLWNLLYIPENGVDNEITKVSKVMMHGNVICSLYKNELEKTTECEKLINAGIRICNATVISDADILALPDFVTMTSAHSDMQSVLREGALA